MAVIQLAPKYSEVLGSLADTTAAEANAVLKGAQGDDVSQHFKIKANTPAAVREGFLRQDLEKEYQELYTKKALETGKCMSLVFQSDILAGLEKTYNMRHRRRLDYLVSGTARARGVSQDTGALRHALPNIPLTTDTNTPNG